MIIDAHFHCWRLERADYGWLTPALGRIYRDVAVGDWCAVAQPLGVEAGVLVQAAPTEAETHFLLQQAAAHPQVRGVVGWVDLLAPDAPTRIEALAKSWPALKGLRPMLQDIPDPDWVLQPALARAFETMTACGLVFDALVKPVHLPRILALQQRHPGLAIVVDHAAKPDIARGQWSPWAEGLAEIARQTRAVCKLSGLLTEAGPQAKADAARRWAGHVLAQFGPQRVLWGSDWPVLEGAARYEDWWGETQALLQPMPAADRDAVLGGNASRVYGLGA